MPQTVSCAGDPTTPPRRARTRAAPPGSPRGPYAPSRSPCCRRCTTGGAPAAARPRGRRSRRRKVAACAVCAGTRSASDERDQLQERDRGVWPDLDLLFQLVHLPVIEQYDEPVAVERLDSHLELSLGVYPAPRAHLETVQGSLRFRRLDETAEVLGLVEVVFAHLPVDAGADQLPHRDPLVRYIEHEASVFSSPRLNVVSSLIFSVVDIATPRRRNPSKTYTKRTACCTPRQEAKAPETARIRASRGHRTPVHTGTSGR